MMTIAFRHGVAVGGIYDMHRYIVRFSHCGCRYLSGCFPVWTLVDTLEINRVYKAACRWQTELILSHVVFHLLRYADVVLYVCSRFLTVCLLRCGNLCSSLLLYWHIP